MREIDLWQSAKFPSFIYGNETPDPVLLRRVAAGNRLAMQVLYLRHHVRVYQLIVRIVRDKVMAEDL